MIRSLITQLFDQCPQAFSLVDTYYEACIIGQRSSTLPDLLKVLHSVTRIANNHVYFILDALDECSEVDDLVEIVAEMRKWNLTMLHILFTSRRLTHIENELYRHIGQENVVNIQSDVVEMDISSYVTERLRTDTKLRRWQDRPDIQEEIRLALVKKADGMYEIYADTASDET